MDGPSTPSLAGPARRSRRNGTTDTTTTPGQLGSYAASTAPRSAVAIAKFGQGHAGSAVNAAGSPYARKTTSLANSIQRPGLSRDVSSAALVGAEAGNAPTTPGPATASKRDRRKSGALGAPNGVDTPSLLGRVVRKSLGWLVGRPVLNDKDADDEDGNDEGLDEQGKDGNGAPRDEESRPQTTTTASSISTSSRINGYSRPSALSIPPPRSSAQRALPGPSLYASTVDGSGDVQDDDELNLPKKMRTSHSTLSIPFPSMPTSSSNGTGLARHASPSRAVSPNRVNGLQRSQTSIFASRPSRLSLAGPTGTGQRNGISPSGSMRSVSPGAISLALPISATSSTFGLQSQSPFRRAHGNSARSPELPVSALNISSGLLRSPSLPRERRISLQNQQHQNSSRLYPYQRSPSVLPQPRNLGIPFSFSMGTGLSGATAFNPNVGSKRSYASAMSNSPPKVSPIGSSFSRYGVGGLSPTRTETDFGGSDGQHRSKRARMSVVWSPERGFHAGNEEGKPTQQKEPEAPKNEAEKVLQRLEGLSRPQIQGLRNTSPKRINVPLPASGSSADSIFATRISSSATTPSLALLPSSSSRLPGYAISPDARRQLAQHEESAAQRDRVRAAGGLGERMRLAEREREEQRRRYEEAEEELEKLRRAAGEEASEEEDLPEKEQKRSQSSKRPSKKSNDKRSKRVLSDEEEVEEDEAREDVDDLPQPKRRTRQRTRELSVMSDASAAEQEQDEESFSPRRSTRISGTGKGKGNGKGNGNGKGKSRARSESVEPDSQTSKSKRRAPKSAKSPQAQDDSEKKKAKSSKGKQTHITDGEEVEHDVEDEDEEEGVTTRSGRRLRSPGPASPPSKASRGKRAASPAAEKHVQPSIAQVMSPEPASSKQKGASMRPERTHRSAQRAPAPSLKASPSKSHIMSFADEDEDEEADARPADQPDETGVSRKDKYEMAKIKLPISNAGIFANRFSFGKVPSSPVLASRQPSREGAPASNTPAAPNLADRLGDKVETPSAASVPSYSFASQAASSTAAVNGASKPMFSFTAPTTTPAPAAAPTPAFSFSKPAAPAADADAPKAAMFSFKAPAASTPAPDVAGTTAPAEPSPAATSTSKPAFSFGALAPSSVSGASSEQPKAPTFSFGAPPAPSSEPKPAAGSEVKAPVFSFGAPKPAAPAASPALNPAPTPSNPFAAFPSPSSTAPDSSALKPAEAASKPPVFSFGNAPGSSTTDKPASQAPTFSFGKPAESKSAEAPAEASKPVFSGFSFKPAAPAPATFSLDTPAKTATSTAMQGSPDAMQQSPPATEKSQPAASTAGPFSPVIATSSKPAFTFGAPPSNPASASVPTFSFGGAQSVANADGSKPTSPFGTPPASSGGTSQPFQFGASKPAATSTPSFTFGGSAAAPAPPSAPGSSSGAAFSFGQNASTNATSNPFGGSANPPAGASAFGAPAQAAKPAFSFGNTASAPAAPATAFSFGGSSSTPGAPPSGTSTPSFTFGASNANSSSAPTPSFSFGAGASSSGGAAPAFSFNTGGAAPAPGAGFTFGAGGAGLASPTMPTTPGGTPMNGNSLFNAGVGGESNSPTKGRRPIKPLRTRRT